MPEGKGGPYRPLKLRRETPYPDDWPEGRVVDRAVHNSPPPMDDVGEDVSHMLDEKDPAKLPLPELPKYALPPNPKQAYGDLKVPLHLVPAAGIIYEAMAFKEGARKYGPYNWRDKAVEAMTYIGGCFRHMQAYLDGENIDPESGYPHIAMARACLGILADATETGNLIDNRPKHGAASELLDRFKAQAAEGHGKD